MVLVMIVIGVAVLAIAIAVVWYLLARGSEDARLWRATFDAEYDELVASGEAADADREAAWKDFHAAQVKDERDQVAWEDPLDG